MTTIQEAIKVIKSTQKITAPSKSKIADALLGKYTGVIPSRITSTQFIKNLRNTAYGKIQ